MTKLSKDYILLEMGNHCKNSSNPLLCGEWSFKWAVTNKRWFILIEALLNNWKSLMLMLSMDEQTNLVDDIYIFCLFVLLVTKTLFTFVNESIRFFSDLVFER